MPLWEANRGFPPPEFVLDKPLTPNSGGVTHCNSGSPTHWTWRHAMFV